MPFRKYRQANCSVVILNAEDAVLGPLLELFYAEALMQKRRAVAAIDMQSIKLAIMSEKSDPAGLAARNAVLSGHPLPNATVAMFIKRRIDEYVLENDRILDILSTNQKVTLLDYWIANDSPSMDASLPAAVGKIKKMKEKETGKMKNVKFKLPTYVKKSRSTIVQRGQIATHKVPFLTYINTFNRITYLADLYRGFTNRWTKPFYRLPRHLQPRSLDRTHTTRRSGKCRHQIKVLQSRRPGPRIVFHILG